MVGACDVTAQLELYGEMDRGEKKLVRITVVRNCVREIIWGTVRGYYTYLLRTWVILSRTARNRGPRLKPRNRITSRVNLPVNMKLGNRGIEKHGFRSNQESLWCIGRPCMAIWEMSVNMVFIISIISACYLGVL